MELELRRFSVNLKRLWAVVDFDLLSSIVPSLPLSTEYCILDFRGRASTDVGDYFIVTCCLLASYVRVYYCSTLSILWRWRMYPYSYNVHINAYNALNGQLGPVR